MKQTTRTVSAKLRTFIGSALLVCLWVFAPHAAANDDNPDPDPYPSEEEPPSEDPCRQLCESGCDQGNDEGNPQCDIPVCDEAGSVFFSMGLGRAVFERKTDSFRNALLAGANPALPSLAHRSRSFKDLNGHYRQSPLTAMRQFKIWIAEEAITSDIYTPAVIKVDQEAGKQLIQDSGGNARQVLTVDRFTDIQPLADVVSDLPSDIQGILPSGTPQGFVIRIWVAGAQGGMVDGLYTLPAGSVAPLSFTVFYNPDASPAEDRLGIIHRRRFNDSSSYKTESFIHHSDENGGLGHWVLSKFDGLSTGTLIEKTTLNQTSKTSDKKFTRIRTVERASLSGVGSYGTLGLVASTLEEFDNIGGDSRLIRKVEAHGTAAERETLYGWYNIPWEEYIHGKLRYIIHPDKSYEHYSYSFNIGARAGSITRRTPWKDHKWTPSSSPPANADCVREIYTISENSISMTRYAANTIVASTTESWATSSGDRIFTQTERYNATQSLTTRTGYYPPDAGYHLANRIKWREFSDGSAETYQYTTPSGGSYTQTIERGAGDRNGITAGTRVVTIRNENGAATSEEKLYFDATGTLQLDFWVATGIESTFGRVTRKEWNDNEHDYEETSYGCCGITEHRDRRGVTTTYQRDALKRTYRVTRAVGAISVDTITSHSFDTDKVIVETHRSDGSEQLFVSKNIRHINGETLEIHGPDQTGNEDTGPTLYVTTYPAAGGREVAITRPDGTTDITLYFVDGNMKSRTGTAVNNTGYDHSVHTELGNGLWKRTTALDAAGGSTSEFTTHYHDRAGRVFRTEFNSQVASSGTNDAVTHSYHPHTAAAGSRGKRSSTTHPDGVTTTFGYDAQGRQASIIELMPVDAGTTRTTATAHHAENVTGIGPSMVTVTRVNTIEVARNIRSGDGYATRRIDNLVRTTTTTRSVPADANAHTWHETTTHPDGTHTRNYHVEDRLVATTRWQSNITASAIPGTAPADIANVSTTGFIDGLAYTHDDFGRMLTSTESRTGTTNYDDYTESGNLLSITDPGNRTTTFAFDKMGRRITTDQPATAIVGGTSQNITHTSYTSKGEVRAVWGDHTNPTFRVYDEQGRMVQLHTWRTNPTITHATTSPPGGSALTTWQYHTSRGWLVRKQYDDNKGTNYTHTAAGRIKTRTWERGNRTRYDYRRGFLVAQRHFIHHSDDTGTNAGNDADTPDIGITYDAFGRKANSITTATANHTGTRVVYQYLASGNLRLLREIKIINPSLNFSLDTGAQAISISENASQRTLFRTLHRDADSITLKNTGTHLRHSLSASSTRDIGTTYNYTNRGLLYTATANFPGGNRTFEYHYDYMLSGGSHVGTDNGKASSIPFAIESPIHTVIRSYDTSRNTLHSQENHVDSTLVSSYTYDVNAIGQRISVTTTGSAFGVGQNFAPADWTWGYDSLGQVVSAKHEDDSDHSRFFDFDFMGNRIESRTGTHSASGGAITDYDRDNLNQYTEIKPPTAAAYQPAYDLDGNMTAGPLPVAKDKLNTLEWDGRNQLIRAYDGTGEGKELLATYTYDAYGRRMVKTDGDDALCDYFLYDGWNLVAEFRGAKHETGEPPAITLRRTFSWGLDLSGTFQGAGGVGGMLAMRNTDDNHYFPTYDGNGNVSEYLDINGVPAAHMEYDTFGNLLPTSTGAFADFPHKFSTKYTDTESGLLYYGYRYYDPVTGRWPSRDPIEEEGGINLYAMIRNNLISMIDKLGLKACTDCDGGFNVQLNCYWTDAISADLTRNADYYSLWDHKLPPKNPEHAKVIWRNPCGDQVNWIERAEVVSTAAPSKARNISITDNKTRSEMSVETWFFVEGLRVGNMPGVWNRLRNDAMSGSTARFCCCKFQNH